jgi:hypothetical protein
MAQTQNIAGSLEQQLARANQLFEDAMQAGDEQTARDALNQSREIVSVMQAAEAPESPKSFSNTSRVVSSEERSQRPYQNAQQPEMVSTVTGMTPSQAQDRAEGGMQRAAEGFTEAAIDTARYGPALVVGLGTAPASAAGLTIGGAIRAMASYSAKTAAAQAVGSIAAQLAELESGQRNEFDKKQIAQETILSALPQYQKGGVIARPFINSFLAAGTSEGAKFLDKGGYQAPKNANEFLMRIGIPVAVAGGTSAISSMGDDAVTATANINRIQRERFVGNGVGGIMLSDVLPRTTGLETGNIARGGQTSNELLNEVGRDIGPMLDRAFPSGASTSEASALIASEKGKIARLHNEWRAAQDATDQANEAFETQKRINGNRIPEAYAAAQKAAFESTKLFVERNNGIMILNRNVNGLEPQVAEGLRMKTAAALAAGARANVSAQIDDLYKVAGVGINDPVITSSGLKGAISHPNYRGPGQKLEDNTMYNEALKVIDNLFDVAGKNPRSNLPANTLSLGDFMRLRDKVSAALVEAKIPQGAASRFASGMYEAVKGASDTYVRRAMVAADPLKGAQRFKAWEFARDAAAADFSSRSTGAIDALSSGKIADLYDSILTQGNGPVMAEIEAYATAISRSGNPRNVASVTTAQNAAQTFRENVFGLIGDSVLDSSLIRGAGHEGSRIIDIPTLAKTVDMLRGKGFPIGKLGLGDPKQLQALARVSSAGTPAGYTINELGSFLDDAQTLGADKAALRVRYKRNVSDTLMLGKAGVQDSIIKQRLNKEIARKAGITEQDAERAYQLAQASPLAKIMDLVKDGQASNITIANGNELVSQLLTSNPENVARLMKALPPKTIDEIRKATAASVMRQFMPVAESGSATKANLERIAQFFEGAGDSEVSQRAAFKAILGSGAYDKLFKDMYGAVKSATGTIRNLGQYEPRQLGSGSSPQVRLKVRVGGSAASYTDPKRILDFIQNRRYGLLYAMYVSPTYSPAFKAVSQNLTTFTKVNPAQAHLVRLINEEDGYTTSR